MARLPVVALVGRPNVGKSTLFNRITRSRAALVADIPGLTRDRQYGRGLAGDRQFIVIDTGGFEPETKTGILVEMARQARQAVLEADVVIFVVDGREGLTGRDLEIGAELRRSARAIFVAVNKTEGMRRAQVAAEFHELGLGEPHPISSAHGDGVRDLLDEVLAPWTEEPAAEEADADAADADAAGAGAAEQAEPPTADEDAAASANEPAGEQRPRVRVAVVGRPNSGKSTLINTLLGEERLIAFDQPGTTRDAVAIDFERGGRPYTLVDTAGLRRRGKVTETIEKFSVVKTLQAIEDSNVCVLLVDAAQDISEQDASIAGYLLDSGRALVIAVNKWDLVTAGARERVKSELERKFHFLLFAKVHYISALTGSGIGAMMRSVDAAYAAATKTLRTPELTRAMIEAVERQAPARRGPIRPKLRYAHQGGRNPPVIVVHGSALDAIQPSYRRYLEGWFRERFKLEGTPLRIEFRSSRNPYAPK